MIRAYITVLAAALVVVTVGGIAFLIALIYPFRFVYVWVARFWSWVILRLAGVRLTIEGREQVADPEARYYVGNHQSGLDIPILIAALRGNVRFLAKDSLFRIPVMGWIMARYGFVSVDRKRPRTTLERVNRALRHGRRNPISLAVFPEGTRSRDGRLLPFRRGAMRIGRRSGLPIVPFSINGSMAVNHPDVMRAIPGPVRLTFLEVIPAKEVAAMSDTELHDRIRAAIVRGLARPLTAPHAGDAPVVVAEGT